MEEPGTTVALYAREVTPTEPGPEPSLYLIDNWDGLEKALESDAEVGAVAFPEVLGDHFTELVVNLSKIAESGKRLQIMGPGRSLAASSASGSLLTSLPPSLASLESAPTRGEHL